jgi:hypothetical protein
MKHEGSKQKIEFLGTILSEPPGSQRLSGHKWGALSALIQEANGLEKCCMLSGNSGKEQYFSVASTGCTDWLGLGVGRVLTTYGQVAFRG